VNDLVAKELARRLRRGLEPRSVAGIRNALAAIGYKMDRSCDARGTNRLLTGEFAGHSYPAINVYVVEADTGMSAFHVNARRDENFRELQRLRFHEELFAVVRDRILEV
jgi:hypothetical protein